MLYHPRYIWVQNNWNDYSLGHYNLAGAGNVEFMNSNNDACQVWAGYYNGISWINTEGDRWNEFGVSVYPTRKCHLKICELEGVVSLSSPPVTYN